MAFLSGLIHPTREMNDEICNKSMVSKKLSNISAILSHIWNISNYTLIVIIIITEYSFSIIVIIIIELELYTTFEDYRCV